MIRPGVWLSALLLITGCRSQSDLKPLAPELASEIMLFEAPPPLQGPISLGSPNAAMRYLAIREAHPLDQASLGWVDTDLDRFGMVDASDDPRHDPAAHREYLIAQQPVIGLIAEASRLEEFDLHPGSRGYRGGPDPDGARAGIMSWMSRVRRLLQDDAVRAWVDGDHAAAIGHAEIMVRIARQRTRTSYPDALDHLLANAWAGAALELLEAMASHPDRTEQDRVRMLHALELLGGSDPIGHFANMRRVLASYDQLVALGLVEPQGSLALWHTVAQAHAIDTVIDSVMKPFEEAAGELVRSGAPATDPLKHPAIEVDALIRAIASELDDLTIDDLRKSYRQARPWVSVAMDELAAAEPDPITLRRIQSELELDETGIPDVLQLTVLSRYVESHQRNLERRERVREALED